MSVQCNLQAVKRQGAFAKMGVPISKQTSCNIPDPLLEKNVFAWSGVQTYGGKSTFYSLVLRHGSRIAIFKVLFDLKLMSDNSIYKDWHSEHTGIIKIVSLS